LISTAASTARDGRGSGNGGGSATPGSGGGADGSAAGITNVAAHVGHVPVVPAFSSAAENVAAHPGQANRIMTSSMKRAGHR
jgi:hypothetical protein